MMLNFEGRSRRRVIHTSYSQMIRDRVTSRFDITSTNIVKRHNY